MAQSTTCMKSAMMAALISPEIGTVTNQAIKMFLNRRQSTDFLERNHPTATTDPTCVHTAQEEADCHKIIVPNMEAVVSYLAVRSADRETNVGRNDNRDG